jgi:hypothetical protein
VFLNRHSRGVDGSQAQRTKASEHVVRNSRPRVERSQTSAKFGVVETRTVVLNTLLLKAVCNLAKPGIFGCIVLSILWNSIPAAGQISPGALSRAHESINGVTDCSNCHELSTGKPTFKCLACHSEIASRIVARKGLHATYGIKPGSSLECASCHHEHNGEDFTLTKWDVKTFDHAKTGYKLDGKHSGLVCSRCHAPQRVSEKERLTIKVKDLSRTFLGVSPDCTNCHQDAHKGRLGPDCLQCHNFSQWNEINIHNFDHSLARYPLTGLHVKVPCQQCHTPGPDKLARYTGIPFRSCNDCHADPHRGGFSQTCQSCHDTAGWNRTLASEMNRTLDHSKTKFPLLGKHVEVECVRCHARGDFKKALAFQKCADCHRQDLHGGQFARRTGGSECSNCHSVDGFKPSTFGLKEHATTAYPLQGKHATLPCAQCHVPKGKAMIYAMKFRYCTDCHADEHAGQFAAAPHLNRCEDCHNLQRFLPSAFGLRRHNEIAYRLSGSHVAVPCGDCHKPSANFRPKATAQYHWQGLACQSCHKDPHEGRLNGFMQRSAPNGTALVCEVCHSTETWEELSRYDHSKTAFPLTGAHKSTKCSGCHKPVDAQSELVHVDFKVAPSKCEACHSDVHGLQFAKSGSTDCGSCHDATRWKPSLLDHDKRTAFALQGAHRNVSCESCHKLTRIVEGKAVRFYKPTPKACVACHRPAVLGKSTPVN